MKVDVLLGLQWGDEGKGKVVDVLTPRYDVVARFQGGPNAMYSVRFLREYSKEIKSILSETAWCLTRLCSRLKLKHWKQADIR